MPNPFDFLPRDVIVMIVGACALTVAFVVFVLKGDP